MSTYDGIKNPKLAHSLPIKKTTTTIIAEIPLGSSRHDTLSTRAFWHREKSWRDVSRFSDSTAQHARHDTCSGAWTGADMSGFVHLTFFQKLFRRLMQILSKRDYTCTRKHYCFFVVRHVGTSTARQARHARHDAHDTYVSCRDKWNLGLSELGQRWMYGEKFNYSRDYV